MTNAVKDPELALKRELDRYDKIFVVPNTQEITNEMLEWLYKSVVLRNSEKKILFISAINFMVNESCEFYKISTNEEVCLKKIYYMYEFSDKFQILSKNNIFGGILNLVETGILTFEEAIKAFLY